MPATLESRFPEIVAELRPRISKAIKEGAEAIAGVARSRVPVRSGALRDAVEVRRHSAAAYRVMGADDEAFYGRFVEYGTKYMEPEPYLIPSADAEKEALEAGVEAVLRTL